MLGDGVAHQDEAIARLSLDGAAIPRDGEREDGDRNEDRGEDEVRQRDALAGAPDERPEHAREDRPPVAGRQGTLVETSQHTPCRHRAVASTERGLESRKPAAAAAHRRTEPLG